MMFPIITAHAVAIAMAATGEHPQRHRSRTHFDLPTPAQLRTDIFGGQVVITQQIIDNLRSTRKKIEAQKNPKNAPTIEKLKEFERKMEKQLEKMKKLSR